MGWFNERFEEKPGRQRYDCMSCGRGMWFPASKLGKYKTCGGDCAAERYAKPADERKRACDTCGSDFIPRPRQLRIGHGRFCSQACNTAVRAAANLPEARRRVGATRRAKFAAGFLVALTGEKNPRWNGGREAWRIRNRAWTAAYKKRNPDRVRAHAANRRRRAAGKLPGDICSRLYRLQRGRCACCRVSLASGYHLDHVLPLATGGSNTPGNVQLLCPRCNTSKGAKHPVAFMQQRGFLL